MTPVEWLTALAVIIFIDLILAGDNAVVIALAARNLPSHLQKKAVFWGTFGAIAARIILVFGVLWLLKIPGIAAVGALFLFGIAYRLMTDRSNRSGKSADSFAAAIGTIVVADTVMSLDNILAIAGAARGDYWLVAIGLLISIPIMVWGSVTILRWLERYPRLVWGGGGVLFLTAARMLLDDKWVKEKIPLEPVPEWTLIILIAVVCTAFGAFMDSRANNNASAVKSAMASSDD